MPDGFEKIAYTTPIEDVMHIHSCDDCAAKDAEIAALRAELEEKGLDTKRLRSVLLNLLAAIKQATDGGAIDHIDCFDDGGAFWYAAQDDARAAIDAAMEDNHA